MAEYTGPERRGNGGWHMSKSLSVSHLLGTLAIAVGFFTYVTGIEQDTIRNQLEIKSLSDRMDRSDARNSEQFGEIKDMLKSLSVKIDNLGHRREQWILSLYIGENLMESLKTWAKENPMIAVVAVIIAATIVYSLFFGSADVPA